MNLIFPLWLCISLPILIVLYILGIFFKNGYLLKHKALAKYYVLPKCAGSYLCVSGAALAIVCHGESPLSHLPFWVLILCFAGDFFIEIHIMAGGIFFGLAHCLLMAYALTLARLHFYSLLIWAGGIFAALIVFRKNIPSMGRLFLPFILYITVLTGDFALALPLVWTAKPRYIFLAAGLLCFIISDMLLGKRYFGARQPWVSRLLMLFYYSALYLIQISLW